LRVAFDSREKHRGKWASADLRRKCDAIDFSAEIAGKKKKKEKKEKRRKIQGGTSEEEIQRREEHARARALSEEADARSRSMRIEFSIR